jgi:hypothetical protein
MSGIPEDQWCGCEPRVAVNGKSYPPAARFDIPGLSWLSSMLGGGKGRSNEPDGHKNKEDL